MANINPLKLVNRGNGRGDIREFETNDYLPIDALALGGIDNNLLIDSSFTINQRAYVSGAATTIANQYTLDRWKIPTIGQNVSWSNYDTSNVNIATAPASGLIQVVEGIRIANAPHVINWVGSASCLINDVLISKGEVFNPPANTNLNVKFVDGTVAKPKLEQGIRPTHWLSPDRSLELIRCFRYYEVGDISGIHGVTYTANGDTRSFIPFHVRKRAAAAVALGGLNIVAFGRLGETVNVAVTPTLIGLDTGIRISVISGSFTGLGPIISWGSTIISTYIGSAEL